MSTIQKQSPKIKKLLIEYAMLYRQYRLDKGYVDYNLDVAVLYGTQDMFNRNKHLPQSDQMLCVQAEINDLKEDLAELASRKVAVA